MLASGGRIYEYMNIYIYIYIYIIYLHIYIYMLGGAIEEGLSGPLCGYGSYGHVFSELSIYGFPLRRWLI